MTADVLSYNSVTYTVH